MSSEISGEDLGCPLPEFPVTPAGEDNGILNSTVVTASRLVPDVGRKIGSSTGPVLTAPRV